MPLVEQVPCDTSQLIGISWELAASLLSIPFPAT